MFSGEKVHAKSFQSCVTLCDAMDCSPPAVHEILQARILECFAISFSRDLPNPGIKPVSPALAGGFVTAKPPRKPKLYMTGIEIFIL